MAVGQSKRRGRQAEPEAARGTLRCSRHLSPEYRRELEERRRADADLVIHDLESKLRYVDRLEDVEDLLKAIGRRVKEIQKKVPLKPTKGS